MGEIEEDVVAEAADRDLVRGSGVRSVVWLAIVEILFDVRM
jgi:hypothetical protein